MCGDVNCATWRREETTDHIFLKFCFSLAFWRKTEWLGLQTLNKIDVVNLLKDVRCADEIDLRKEARVVCFRGEKRTEAEV